MPDLGVYGKKVGPLPVWAWGGLGLGVALGIAQFRAGKNSKKSAEEDNAADDSVPADQVPSTIFQNYTTVNVPGGVPGPAGPGGPAGPPGPPATPPVAPPKKPAKPPLVPSKERFPEPIQYRVKKGDTLSSIAKKYGTTWQSIWKYNTTSGNRPAATIKKLKDRGPNLLYANELILIPPKK